MINHNILIVHTVYNRIVKENTAKTPIPILSITILFSISNYIII